jgi:hypothetical protein
MLSMNLLGCGLGGSLDSFVDGLHCLDGSSCILGWLGNSSFCASWMMIPYLDPE